MEGFKEFTQNFNDFYNGCKGFFQGCGNTFSFINRCFTEDRFLIDNIKHVAPGVLLVFVAILIILRLLGFENSNKWIALAFVLALLISAL